MVVAKEMATKIATGDVDVEAFPSPAGILHEHAKTLITIATSFFGLSIAFADKLVGATPARWQLNAMRVGWALLLFCLLCSIVVVVQLNAVAAGKSKAFATTWKIAANAATLAYISLLAAALAVGAASLLADRKPDINAAASVQRAVLFVSKLPQHEQGQWRVEQLAWNSSRAQFTVLLVAENLNSRVCVSVSKSGDVQRFERCLNIAP